LKFILRFCGKGSLPTADVERVKRAPGVQLIRQTASMLVVEGGFDIITNLASSMSQWTAMTARAPLTAAAQRALVPVAAALPKDPQFRVIYADPPWPYRKAQLDDLGAARAVEKEYATMSIEDIAALPVATLAAPDAVLFMWATGPKLLQALRVMEAWGFEYRTIAFVWVKLTTKADKLFFGMGFYTRANAEIVLVGTRGRGCKRIDAGVPQIVLDPYDGPSEEPVAVSIGRHSEKPDEVRRRIERLYEGPRIELFAREQVRDWTVWGNETPEIAPESSPESAANQQ
jgi:N6-adenosine-specific RNA methylase IME4